MPEEVVRRLESAIHWIAIFSTVVKMLKIYKIGVSNYDLNN